MLVFLFNTIFFAASLAMVIYLIVKRKKFLSSYRFLLSSAILFVTVIMYVGIIVASVKAKGDHSDDVVAWNDKRTSLLSELSAEVDEQYAASYKKCYEYYVAELEYEEAVASRTNIPDVPMKSSYKYEYDFTEILSEIAAYNTDLTDAKSLCDSGWTGWYRNNAVLDATLITEEETNAMMPSDYSAWTPEEEASAKADAEAYMATKES